MNSIFAILGTLTVVIVVELLSKHSLSLKEMIVVQILFMLHFELEDIKDLLKK